MCKDAKGRLGMCKDAKGWLGMCKVAKGLLGMCKDAKGRLKDLRNGTLWGILYKVPTPESNGLYFPRKRVSGLTAHA